MVQVQPVSSLRVPGCRYLTLCRTSPMDDRTVPRRKAHGLFLSLSPLTLIRCRCISVEVPFFLRLQLPTAQPRSQTSQTAGPRSHSPPQSRPFPLKVPFPSPCPPIPHLSCFSPSLHRHSLPLCDRFFPFFFPFTFFFFPLSHSLDILNIQPSRYPSLFPGPLLSFRLDITTHPQSPRPHPF